MLELLFCATLTVLPDYLFRRYVQGKRIGHEITLYSVWFELRWGITACLILTVALITVIFYYHPTTRNVISVFRTVPVLPEGSGRVAEVHVGLGERVEAGEPLFRLDSSAQEAAVESARQRVVEAEAAIEVARNDLATADGTVQQAEGALALVQVELERSIELQRRSPGAVALREIDRLGAAVQSNEGSLIAAKSRRQTVETQLESLLPAQKAVAEATLAEAQVALDKTIVRAGVTGTMEQFALRPGDIVNALRPAGILVPETAGRLALQAGFDQIEAQVLKEGMAAEVTCVSRPFAVIPMVIVDVQRLIAAGQLRPTDQLFDASQAGPPGTITVHMEPLWAGGLDRVPPGSACIANAYTDNHAALEAGGLGVGQWLFLHMVDTVGVVHAMILRFQALLLPVQTLVFSGH